jgi:hypothetical protein
MEPLRQGKRRLRLSDHTLAKFGLTRQQANALWAQQGYSCAICCSGGKICVDHDHETNEVRGFICTQCNCMLGFASDVPAVLERGAAYLRNSPTRLPIPARGRAVRRYQREIEAVVGDPTLTSGSARARALAAQTGMSFNAARMKVRRASGHVRSCDQPDTARGAIGENWRKLAPTALTGERSGGDT